jgi:Putative transposase/Transposase zinc-binding domain
MITSVGPTRPAVEVADVIREYDAAFRARYGGALTAGQRRALHDLAVCRTAALGGHLQRCNDCGHEEPAYNSCRNRHCPKCQAACRAAWLDREAGFLLPVAYHHVVFTLPAAVAEAALAQPALLYDLLFQAAAATLRDVAANPKRLGAQIGVLMVLHTWGQNLHHHPHVHCVATGGGLSCNAQGIVDAAPQWRSCRPGFFLPVRVLSRVFRGKYLALLRQAFAQGRLRGWPDADAFARWLAPLFAKEWVVYAKPPFGGPERVLKYLAAYTHRVAISNQRLTSLAEGRVTFRYKDYADDRRQKTMSLSAEEFLRRFVQHVLPKGFVKVRHYGLLANRRRAERLEVSRKLLLLVTTAAILTGTPPREAEAIEPVRVRCCPQCGSVRRTTIAVPRGGAGAAAVDTS